MTIRLGALGLIIGLGVATASLAAPRLDGVISDHAVLQRDRPLVVTGQARAGEMVTIALAGRKAQGRADGQGRFRLTLQALPAGGPHQLLVSAPSGQLFVDDLMIGDVFLCSGQSNMELSAEQAQNSFQIAGAADAGLRLLTVAKQTATAPLVGFNTPPAWTAATPQTIAKFSAVCFYTGQALRETVKAPIGLIHASWGGSRISAWMAPQGLAAAGMEAQAQTLALYNRDTAAADAQAGAAWETWWREQSGDRAGQEPWRTDGRLTWAAAPGVGYFNRWGVAALSRYVGMVWFKKEFDLTAAQARQSAVLSLGAIDDADRTWVNGAPVGGGSIASAPRQYRLAPGALVEGRNVITVNVDNVYAEGGMTGPASLMQLRFDDGSSLPLDAGWRYAIGGKPRSNAPRSPWDDINGAGTLYNAMIAPLGPTALRGVAWYQGESDTDAPGYDRRLTAMMADWRTQFAAPDLPFAVIQLSAYGATASAPTESGWARLRDIQRHTAEADGRAAVVVTVDLGDRFDIHPGEKQEVGRRSARALRALAYRESIAASGPRIASALRQADGGVTLTVADAEGGLVMLGADRAIGFEACEAAGACRYADARAMGDHVVLAGVGRSVTRVRYAWADSPVINVFDRAGQPLGPFEIAVP
uniref:Sialate O-acetylesterase domain-containing protein n=1 Tax=Caulobacter sp. (strain K31) TaxID=366602 RepID=B0SVR2_CAUSK